MRSAECGVRNAEWGVRNAECGMRNAEWGMRSGECGVRNAEWGVGSAERGMRSAEWGEESEMTGRELILNLVRDGRAPRVPVMPITMMLACDQTHYTYRDYAANCRVLA